MSTTPHAATRLAKFIEKRIGELPGKTQAEIARDAGFNNANFITMLKNGTAKLPLERVTAFAKALDADPSHVMRLALEQSYGRDMLDTMVQLLAEPLTENERAWLKIIRDASKGTDPSPARTIQRVLNMFFRDN